MRKEINHARSTACFSHAEMHRRGYERLGAGSFARVYSHPNTPNIVVKIGHYKSRHFTNYRCGFPTIAKLKSRSKFLPRVYELREDPDNNQYLAIIKRYKPLRSTKTKTLIASTGRIIQGSAYPHDRGDLKRFARVLGPFADRTKFCLDLHSGNIMQDENGTPILTDPLLHEV